MEAADAGVDRAFHMIRIQGEMRGKEGEQSERAIVEGNLESNRTNGTDRKKIETEPNV